MVLDKLDFLATAVMELWCSWRFHSWLSSVCVCVCVCVCVQQSRCEVIKKSVLPPSMPGGGDDDIDFVRIGGVAFIEWLLSTFSFWREEEDHM